jgi:hypothetical protein
MRSPIIPQNIERPHPARNIANRKLPQMPMFAVVTSIPDAGSSSRSAGTSTSP